MEAINLQNKQKLLTSFFSFFKRFKINLVCHGKVDNVYLIEKVGNTYLLNIKFSSNSISSGGDFES